MEIREIKKREGGYLFYFHFLRMVGEGLYDEQRGFGGKGMESADYTLRLPVGEVSDEAIYRRKAGRSSFDDAALKTEGTLPVPIAEERRE